MNTETAELVKRIEKLERRVTEMEMRGATSVREGVGALDEAVTRKISDLEKNFKREVGRLENWIKNTRLNAG